jgi:hypothetical protein
MRGFSYDLIDTEAGTRVCSAVTPFKKCTKWMVNKQAKLNAEHHLDELDAWSLIKDD